MLELLTTSLRNKNIENSDFLTEGTEFDKILLHKKV